MKDLFANLSYRHWLILALLAITAGVVTSLVTTGEIKFWSGASQQKDDKIVEGFTPAEPKVLSNNTEASVPPVIVDPGPELITPVNTAAIRAKSFLIYDVRSGKQLAAKNETFPLPIASLTKLMTAYVAYTKLDLSSEVVTVSNKDTLSISPVLGLHSGDKVLAVDLFNSMLIGSANDAAKTLANHMTGKTGVSFTALMNQTAAEIGMKNTRYSNALGFDSETNYSTAADLELLVNAVKQFEAFTLIGRDTSYKFTALNGRDFSIKATNKLVAGNSEISAIKTGYTNEAQGSMITEVNHNNNKFIIIVLASPNREQDTLNLRKAVIESYRWE